MSHCVWMYMCVCLVQMYLLSKYGGYPPFRKSCVCPLFLKHFIWFSNINTQKRLKQCLIKWQGKTEQNHRCHRNSSQMYTAQWWQSGDPGDSQNNHTHLFHPMSITISPTRKDASVRKAWGSRAPASPFTFNVQENAIHFSCHKAKTPCCTVYSENKCLSPIWGKIKIAKKCLKDKNS